MAFEFTAVYEPQPNGNVVAYLAELPAITVGAHNLEEARARLAEQARLFLEQERLETLDKLGPDARVEPLRIDVGIHRETRADADIDRETRVEGGSSRRAPRVDHEGGDLLECLVQQGVLPGLAESDIADEDFEPIAVDGRPISEEIIEARR